MADQNVRIILTAKNETGGAISSAQGGVERLTSAAKKFASVAAVAFATKKMVDFGVESVLAFSQAEAATERMAQILRTAVDATDEQVASLQQQAEALEKIGVVGKEAILVGQGQLASFDLQAASIEKLIPSILNYAVAERGANLSGEELKSVTNGLAQALQGNFASLTKTGFVLDDVTKNMISTGTESERVAALVRVLDSTYSGLNETMRQTTEGQLVGLQFALGNLKEQIGGVLAQALVPFIGKLTELAQNPQFVDFFVNLVKFGVNALIKAIELLVKTFDAMVGGWLVVFDVLEKIRSAFDRVASAARSAWEAASRVGGNIVSGAKALVGRQHGGPVSPSSPFLVGEAGPEIFRPKVAGDIIPSHSLASAGIGGITINITGNTLLDSFAGERIADQIMKAIKSNLRL